MQVERGVGVGAGTGGVEKGDGGRRGRKLRVTKVNS